MLKTLSKLTTPNHQPFSCKILSGCRGLSTTPVLNEFYEKYEKGGYKDKRPQPSKTEFIRDGFKQLKHEIALWRQEMKEKFEVDPILYRRPGETDIVWSFGDEKSLDNWIVTSDSDHEEGFSSCNLTLSKYGKGIFAGELVTRVPKDGRIKSSGYCNMKTLRARKSFKREAYLDWTVYNTLVLRVRGDGRNYLLNIATKGYFDITWNDVYHYVLYTRGGPYWQTAKIPFSKFFKSSKGRIQDRQNPVPLDKITSFGISVGKRDGDFRLEIDYIGVEVDTNNTEEFAYEMYETPLYVAGY